MKLFTKIQKKGNQQTAYDRKGEERLSLLLYGWF